MPALSVGGVIFTIAFTLDGSGLVPLGVTMVRPLSFIHSCCSRALELISLVRP